MRRLPSKNRSALRDLGGLKSEGGDPDIIFPAAPLISSPGRLPLVVSSKTVPGCRGAARQEISMTAKKTKTAKKPAANGSAAKPPGVIATIIATICGFR